MPTNEEFSRVDLGPREPNFQGQRDNAQGPVSGQYERVDTARNSDPSANLSSSTWRDDSLRPENILDEQARLVQESVDAKRSMDEAFGLNPPVAGPGVHTWLRDARGYGNQEPDGEQGIPQFRNK